MSDSWCVSQEAAKEASHKVAAVEKTKLSELVPSTSFPLGEHVIDALSDRLRADYEKKKSDRSKKLKEEVRVPSVDPL